MRDNEILHWMTLSHMAGIPTSKKNDVIIYCHKRNIDLSDFMLSEDIQYKLMSIGWSKKEVTNLYYYKNWLIENEKSYKKILDLEVFTLLISDRNYPSIIKKTLKRKHTPTILYYKGRLDLLSKNIVFICNRNVILKNSEIFIRSIIHKAKNENMVLLIENMTKFDNYLYQLIKSENIPTIFLTAKGIINYLLDNNNSMFDNRCHLILSPSPPHMSWFWTHGIIRDALSFCLASKVYVPDMLGSEIRYKFLEKLSSSLDGFILCRQPKTNESSGNSYLIKLGATALDDNLNKIIN